MVLQLHIWGPAFSLPSIDPQCLAAIIYLKHTLPLEAWELIASSDDSLSPTKALPALRDDTTWVGGFRNIVSHLSKRGDHSWDLDSGKYSLKAQADITAYTSFIEAHGQPLLDLSFFVSSENYTSATRPVLSQLLQWPRQWLTSPQKRLLAKTRTEHLGLSSLDLDSAYESNTNPTMPAISDVIPQSLRTSRPTVTSLAKQPQHATRFRLEALADAFFGPLQETLGKKCYMMSEDQPSSLDAMAVAYLALMLIPQVPQKWLAETMTARYPELCAYVRRCTKECFGGPLEFRDATLRDEGEEADKAYHKSRGDAKDLLWGKPAQKGVREAGSALLTGTLSSLPMVERFSRGRVLLADSNKDAFPTDISEEPENFQPLVVPSLLALGSVISALGSYFLYTNVFHHAAPEKKSLSEMGSAGAILGMGLFGYNAGSLDERQRQGRVPVGLEMDVEVDEAAAK